MSRLSLKLLLAHVFVLDLVFGCHHLRASNWEFSGYATIGYSYENEERLGIFRDSTQRKRFDRNGSFWPDSQIGLQVTYQFSNRLRATTQVVYADKADYRIDSAIEWAFLAYQPRSDIDLRIGRLSVDMFRISDVRRLDFASMWLRPPSEVYGWIIPYSIDGIDVSKEYLIGDSFWRVKLQLGRTSPEIQTPDGNQTIETQFNRFAIISAVLDRFVWSSRFTYARFTTADIGANQLSLVQWLDGLSNIPSPAGGQAGAIASTLLSSYSTNVSYLQGSLSYQLSNWRLHGEIVEISGDTVLMPTGVGVSAVAGYQSDSMTPFAILSHFKPGRDPYFLDPSWAQIPGNEILTPIVLGIFNGPLISQSTASLGVKWGLSQNAALKFQWDKTKIKENGYGLWAYGDQINLTDTDIDVFSLSLSVIF